MDKLGISARERTMEKNCDSDLPFYYSSHHPQHTLHQQIGLKKTLTKQNKVKMHPGHIMLHTIHSFMIEKVIIYLQCWSDLWLCRNRIRFFIFFAFVPSSNISSLTNSFGKFPFLHFLLVVQHNHRRMCREYRRPGTVTIFPRRAIRILPKALEKFVKYNTEVETLLNFSSISLLHCYFCSNISAGVPLQKKWVSFEQNWSSKHTLKTWTGFFIFIILYCPHSDCR